MAFFGGGSVCIATPSSGTNVVVGATFRVAGETTRREERKQPGGDVEMEHYEEGNYEITAQ